MQDAKDIFDRQNRGAWASTLSAESRRILLESLRRDATAAECFRRSLDAAVLSILLFGVGMITTILLITL